MTDHPHRTIERHCDVAVVGGSAAGLAAALQLGRQRRSVIVVDSGEPRNAPAAHMHGYLGHEGIPPAALTTAGRDEVRRYGGEILSGRAEQVSAEASGLLRVGLVGGHSILARRVLAATGLVDELPDVDGLTRHWGGAVVHCPFCHGYEVRDRRIVAIVTHPMGLHPTPLFRQLSERLTVVLHGEVQVDPAQLELLAAAGVSIVVGWARRIVEDQDGRLTGVELDGAATLDADVVVVGPGFHARIEPFRALGLRAEAHPSGLGDAVRTDEAGATSVPLLYAAGNVTDPSQQVLQAAADGSRVAAMISFSLAEEDVRNAARPSANQADWDHRYSGEQMWSGRPNGTLVNEVSGLPAGRALDVGAGEGGDAMWLAEQGWTVTAMDVSDRALLRVRAEADRRKLALAYLHADANAFGAIPAAAFDLVSAQYASIPRTPDERGVQNLLDAVAPGGTLLVVSHDIEPMRQAIDTRTDSRAFDPDAYVRVEDFAAGLADSPDWEVQVHDKRPRPHGAASTHHVEDVVLRARRLTG